MHHHRQPSLVQNLRAVFCCLSYRDPRFRDLISDPSVRLSHPVRSKRYVYARIDRMSGKQEEKIKVGPIFGRDRHCRGSTREDTTGNLRSKRRVGQHEAGRAVQVRSADTPDRVDRQQTLIDRPGIEWLMAWSRAISPVYGQPDPRPV